MLLVELVVRLGTAAGQKRTKVKSNDLPLILHSCSLYAHDKSIQRPSGRIDEQATRQLEDVSSIKSLLKKAVTAVVGNPGAKCVE